MSNTYNMLIDAGAGYSLPIIVRNTNLTGATGQLQFRRNKEDAGDPVIDATTANGKLSITYSAPDSLIVFELEGNDTESLTDVYFYDLFVTVPASQPVKYLKGTAKIDPAVTR